MSTPLEQQQPPPVGVSQQQVTGRPIMGHGQYDFEGWVERKCSSCLEGRVDPPPPRPTEEVLVAVPAEETQQEIKEKEHEQSQVQGQKQHGSSSDS
ncbi:hypothetical protein CRYUN_Cryun18bG0101700 [Craigia yunnanensis]